MHPISQKLLDIIVCPITKGPLTLSSDGHFLISVNANMKFPIRDGIPILVVEESISLSN
jgi:uncharacterized protein YbaR (Trm112 family)